MERLYRDPVHNIIALSLSQPDDALLVRLIDSPEFQRLRYIKQLGLALYTFQGAEHSRFTHSLGVMHIMTRVLDHLGKRYSISNESRVVARAAALLHDLGHGPFSHVIEKVLRHNHERWTTQIIADPATTVHQLLSAFDPALPKKVIAAIEHRYRPAFIGDLVSSQLDVDRFDYLLRDSLMTGAKYGNYDLEWILHALEIDEANERIYVAANGLYAVEEYLQARFYMFRQVYFHRSLRSAETVLMSILRRAVTLMQASKLQFVVIGSVMERVLKGEELTTAEYLRFDDHDVMFHLKQWMREPDAILRDLARRFLERRLFKAIDLEMPDTERAEFLAEAAQRVTALGFDPAYYLIEDRAADIPYYSYYRPEGKARLLIQRNGSGELADIADVSGVVRGMRGYELRRLCFPAEASEAIKEAKWD
ncbi:MAG TPA: HD domain-containing protein [Blastocatellia bacterium]|nr:HD domain-containing protein [Blastocatellia bacterium]HMX25488.1 HD domain-containing protein [Blastocatellia bacterium]HMY76519.1 HD domain-containing protein [Blastocatellia bacterium]HMZ20069.1 HD domain-containing protein [Blastocatellia bacterium]HNG32270.1 HD domain-containing protein [Blastocatellia bacterium]